VTARTALDAGLLESVRLAAHRYDQEIELMVTKVAIMEERTGKGMTEMHARLRNRRAGPRHSALDRCESCMITRAAIEMFEHGMSIARVAAPEPAEAAPIRANWLRWWAYGGRAFSRI
jgi:hypothetical protein